MDQGLSLSEAVQADGFQAGRDRIGQLWRELGLMCRQKRKFKMTIDSKHDLPVAQNILKRNFTATAPNQVWGADITYVPTAEGWLYLSGIKDIFTREVVG